MVLRCHRPLPSTDTMTSLHPLFFIAAAGIASAIPARAATVVDTFTGTLSSQYTLTRVLDNASGANVSFSTTGGALRASYSGLTNAAEQVLLLRNDFTLAVGNTLTVDVSQATSTSQMDFGIAVATTKSPTGVITTGDSRSTFDWTAIYVRPNENSVRNLSVTGSPTRTLTSASGILSGVDETTVKTLWIKRDSTDVFSLGYISSSNVSVTARTVTLSGFGATPAFGFYADLRANGGTLGTLDNLTLVPEPSSAALGGLAVLTLVFRRKR